MLVLLHVQTFPRVVYRFLHRWQRLWLHHFVQILEENKTERCKRSKEWSDWQGNSVNGAYVQSGINWGSSHFSRRKTTLFLRIFIYFFYEEILNFSLHEKWKEFIPEKVNAFVQQGIMTTWCTKAFSWSVLIGEKVHRRKSSDAHHVLRYGSRRGSKLGMNFLFKMITQRATIKILSIELKATA